MLNSEAIILRIQRLIENHQLNASSFAARIGVQRSSISHLLSGRNKPSLEFLAKIEAAFEEVTFSWLLKGDSPPSSKLQKRSFDSNVPLSPTPAKSKSITSSSSPYPILKEIVYFFEDGTFEVYRKRH